MISDNYKPLLCCRALLIWSWASTPLLALGVLVAWVGVALDDLRIMLSGIILCMPMLLGIYGLLFVGTIISIRLTMWAVYTRLREMARHRLKGMARLVHEPAPGVWDREMDGWSCRVRARADPDNLG